MDLNYSAFFRMDLDESEDSKAVCSVPVDQAGSIF